MPKIAEQYAALPYRLQDGHPEVLLVTSRETRRWILPKGKPEKGVKPWKVAEKEAFEEAGALGVTATKPYGRFDSVLRDAAGVASPCRIEVYLLQVEKTLDDWPEKHERSRKWVTPAEAAVMVNEGGLIQLLLTFGSQWD